MKKEDKVLFDQIEQALDKIRPFLEQDGGDVKLLEVVDGKTVKIELLGSCVTCPMSSMTLRAGVEESIKKSVPEIEHVIATNVEVI